MEAPTLSDVMDRLDDLELQIVGLEDAVAMIPHLIDLTRIEVEIASLQAAIGDAGGGGKVGAAPSRDHAPE